jgi:beta-phosphoglucomutase-like phosphatase (HAD superfamily)
MALLAPLYILCDMDGTLVDTEGLKCEAWLRAVSDVSGGEPDPEEHRVLYTTLVGRPGEDMADVILDHYGLSVDPKHLRSRREHHRRELSSDTARLA